MSNYSIYANLAQNSINQLFYTKNLIQFINNVYPLRDEKENETFNYWWIAHLIDVRLDAYLRTKESSFLEEAEETYRYNKTRNKNTLLHEYYDDMLWNALAALRLFEITKKNEYFEDAKEVCLDIFDTAWNDQMHGGFAWKRTQLDYKNTPVNAPIIILALRLYQIEKDDIYLETSKKTLAWMQKYLVQPVSKFVEDGINRNADGKIDTQWQFTYNQGVYIGALIEFYQVTKESKYLKEALQCAKTALDVLVEKGVFHDEGDGGDIGLFKGILYRYLEILYRETGEDFIKEFIFSSCDLLIKYSIRNEQLLAYRDWLVLKTPDSIYLSDELSGVMALEAAAAIKKN